VQPAAPARMPPRVAAGHAAWHGGCSLPRMDLVALGIVVGFFALSWGFVALCERL